MALDINITEIIIVVVSVTVPIFLQNHSIKKDLTMKIKNAVDRDAKERDKIYDKLCKLNKKVNKVLHK